MGYLRAEHLKFKRTISNKLIWIAPMMTAAFAWLVGGFIGFQYMTFYWWYAFLLPGTIAVLCVLAHQKEEHAGKYYSVFSAPVDLTKWELAKLLILVEKLMIAALFLAAFVSISNLISPATVVYSIGRSIIGCIALIASSIWQIPLCLYLVRKVGMALPIILNSVLGIFSPIVFGSTSFWWLCPYCWPAKLAEPLLGIEINGTFAGNTSFSMTVILSLALSVLLFTALALWDAKSFSQKERK